MWQHDTPCQQRPEEFTPRRGGETYEDYVWRADVARMICESQCQFTRECADFATRVAVTGLCAGSLYEEGVRHPLPKPREGNVLDRRRGQDMCCRECEAQYIDMQGNPLCRNCRRKAFTFFTGAGEAGGESPTSRIGRQSYSEAA
jgi:hypothetical protein